MLSNRLAFAALVLLVEGWCAWKFPTRSVPEAPAASTPAPAPAAAPAPKPKEEAANV